MRDPRVYFDNVWSGLLEARKSYRSLPEGGSLRPADGIELAIRLCTFEEREGRPAALDDLMPFEADQVSKFAQWSPGPHDGQLAALLVDQCRKLLS